MYYVYIYYHPDTGIPFYVGKGSGERYKKHLTNARNPHLRNKINKLRREGYEPTIEIVFRTENEDLAYDIEEFMITQYKRSCDGGSLCNQDLGTRGSKVHDFDEKFYEMLGKVSDHKIAEIYKCSHALVSHYRRGLGIPPAPRRNVWSEGHTNLTSKELDDLVSRLGKAKDKELSKLFDVSVNTIRNMREHLGIPAYYKIHTVDKSLLGTMYDCEIAEMFGCDSTDVANLRKKEGIPSYEEKLRNTLHVFYNKDRILKMTAKRFQQYSGISKDTVRELIVGRVKKTRTGWSYKGLTVSEEQPC